MGGAIVRLLGAMAPVGIDARHVQRFLGIEVDVKVKHRSLSNRMPHLHQLRLVRACRDVAVEGRDPFGAADEADLGVRRLADRRHTHEMRRLLAMDRRRAVGHQQGDRIPARAGPTLCPSPARSRGGDSWDGLDRDRLPGPEGSCKSWYIFTTRRWDGGRFQATGNSAREAEVRFGPM